jgi:hypothetical protein
VHAPWPRADPGRRHCPGQAGPPPAHAGPRRPGRPPPRDRPPRRQAGPGHRHRRHRRRRPPGLPRGRHRGHRGRARDLPAERPRRHHPHLDPRRRSPLAPARVVVRRRRRVPPGLALDLLPARDTQAPPLGKPSSGPAPNATPRTPAPMHAPPKRTQTRSPHPVAWRPTI